MKSRARRDEMGTKKERKKNLYIVLSKDGNILPVFFPNQRLAKSWVRVGFGKKVVPARLSWGEEKK